MRGDTNFKGSESSDPSVHFYSVTSPHAFHKFRCVVNMAVESSGKVWSKDMKTEDLNEFSNIFASEFNNSDIHDRVLCFQVIIEDEEFEMNFDSEPESQSETAELTGSDRFGDVQMVSSLPKSPDIYKDEDEVKIYEKRKADGNYVCK